MTNDSLYGKRVIVLGFGRQGRALARWLPSVGAQVVVSDMTHYERDILSAYPDVEFVLGSHPESLLDQADLVCLSGGVSLELPFVRAAVGRGIPLSNDAQLFLERTPVPVVGITGSAGKTTTTTLTGQILQAAGFKTWVGGNIGNVLLDVLPEIEAGDRVVMELSSFQLEIMTRSPHIAAVLNVTPNHLDRHITMENYTQAKSHILRHQVADDVAVLGYDDVGSRALESLTPGRVTWFSLTQPVTDGACMQGDALVVRGLSSVTGAEQVICTRDALQLRGAHNLRNVLAACAVSGTAGAQAAAMAEAIRGFKGVAHRQEVIRTVDGVRYINDSIATAPERVLAGLLSYEEPVVLLLGGKDKNLPWEPMLRVALERVRHIVAFGHAGDLIMRQVAELGGADVAITQVADLTGAVHLAAAYAQPGDVVLLSPGGTSYDAYADFAARGDHFRQLVMAL